MDKERESLLKFCYEAFVEEFFYSSDVDKHLHLFNGFLNSDITKEEFEAYAETRKKKK